MHSPLNHSDSFWHKPLFHRLLILAVFAAGLTPTVPMVQFTGGMENFNIATAQESQRDGHWLMPYLGLQPRAAKPPLVHWITAIGIQLFPNSMAWACRLPSIFVSCFMLLAVYELGRTLDDWPLGLTGAFVCGTTILFLKFAWQAEYDLHLALWVTVTNACLAMATFKDRRWFGCLGAGAALGLALMSKGPPAFIETILPWAAYLAWRRWKWKLPTIESGMTTWTMPILGGIALMLLVAIPWTLYAFWVNRHMVGLIFNEVTLGTEREYETRIRWHSYIVFFPMMLPWLIWFLTGFVEIARLGRAAAKLWMAIFLLVLPIAALQPFAERRDRYLLPMIVPASLIAAYGVLKHVPKWRKWTGWQRLLVILHGCVLIVFGIGLPIWGHYLQKTVEGQPWYSAQTTATAILAAVVIGAVSLLIYRKSRFGFIAGTVAIMLLANLVFLSGYRNSSSGRSEGKRLADQILSAYPDALIYNAAPKNRSLLPLELLIYLDRDVPSIDDPTKLPPSDRPQVLLYPPDAHSSPVAAPPGFHEFAQRKINTGMYHVFVRERG